MLNTKLYEQLTSNVSQAVFRNMIFTLDFMGRGAKVELYFPKLEKLPKKKHLKSGWKDRHY